MGYLRVIFGRWLFVSRLGGLPFNWLIGLNKALSMIR
jgi:hypothetical protein